VQIIAGKYKGNKIRRTDTLAVRPCSSRVKKSLFDTLSARMDFEGSIVLDLFAGFGSLGFEALSRGSEFVYFVDQHTDALKSMKSTALHLGVTDKSSIVNSDVTAFLDRTTEQFDLVFCDPPYTWPDYELLIEKITAKSVLSEEGILLIEHKTHLNFKHLPTYSFHKDYGMTRVTFFHH